jgi:hypothetical protein
MIEVQRLEEQSRRKQEEKNRRIKQQLAAAQAEKETADKIAARAFARVSFFCLFLFAFSFFCIEL